MFKKNAARTILTVLVALSSTIHGFAGSVRPKPPGSELSLTSVTSNQAAR